MKTEDSQLTINGKCGRQNGTITVACALTLVLVTIVAITTIPNLSAIIPPNVQHVIVAIVAAQVAALTFSGRRENQ